MVRNRIQVFWKVVQDSFVRWEKQIKLLGLFIEGNFFFIAVNKSRKIQEKEKRERHWKIFWGRCRNGNRGERSIRREHEPMVERSRRVTPQRCQFSFYYQLCSRVLETAGQVQASAVGMLHNLCDADQT